MRYFFQKDIEILTVSKLTPHVRTNQWGKSIITWTFGVETAYVENENLLHILRTWFNFNQADILLRWRKKKEKLKSESPVI